MPPPKSGSRTKNTTTSGSSPAEAVAVTPPPLDADEAWVSLAVFTVALAVYLRTLHPSVAGGDAGELMTVAHEIGTPHPPGYPTFAMTTKAAEVVLRWLIPSLSIGHAQNAFHATLSAAAVGLLCRAASRLTGSAPAGVAASFVFGFAPNVWTYAIVTEVFALNNFLMCLLVLLAVDFWRVTASTAQAEVKQRVRWSAFACGLALTNQHTSVLFVLPIILWVVLSDLRRYVKDTPALVAYFLLGMSPYLYLPVSSTYSITTNSWGRLNTWSGFWDHFFRKEYGTFSLASKEATYRVSNFTRAWRYYFYDMAEQTLWCLWILAALGVGVTLLRATRAVRSQPRATLRQLPVDAVLFLTWLAYCNFFHYLANLPIDQPLFYGVQQRFWLQPLILVAVFVAVGFQWVVQKFGLSWSTAMGAALVVAAMPVLVHFNHQDESQNYYVHDFGKALLRPLPPNSILLTKGDIQINSARFVQVCEGFRPDIVILDQELLTYAWYNEVVRARHPDITLPGTSYYPNRPGLYDMKRLLDANMKRGRRVFVAWGWKEGDPSTTNHYTLSPFGSATEVLSNTKAQKLKTDLKLRAERALEVALSVPFNLTAHRIPPANRYSTISWEHVVREDFQSHLIGVSFEVVRAAETAPTLTPAVVEAVQRVGVDQCANMTLSMSGATPQHHDEAKLYCALLIARRTYDFVFDTFDASKFPYYVRRNYGVALQVLDNHEPNPARKRLLQAEMLEQMKLHLAESGHTLEQADRQNIERVVEHLTTQLRH